VQKKERQERLQGLINAYLSKMEELKEIQNGTRHIGFSYQGSIVAKVCGLIRDMERIEHTIRYLGGEQAMEIS
jgi:hypothetical protein